jgi:hypothetical protein
MKLLMTQQPLKPEKIGTNFESIEFSTLNQAIYLVKFPPCRGQGKKPEC